MTTKRAAPARRSAAKRTRRKPARHVAGRPYADDVRERALELLRVDGVAAAHAATGIPKGTLSRWARNAGVDLGAATRQTKAAAEARAAQLADETTKRLDHVIELASRGLIRRLEANADVAELDDDDLGPWSRELERFVPSDDRSHTAKALRRAQLLDSAGVPVRDLVGSLTRAIHDLSLLTGEATERGDVVVKFGIPRPTEPANVLDVDAQPD